MFVQIEYCVPCGHLERALDVQKQLLEHFGRRLEGVQLKTGKDGVFRVTLGEDQLYEKSEEFDFGKLAKDIEESGRLIDPA